MGLADLYALKQYVEEKNKDLGKKAVGEVKKIKIPYPYEINNDTLEVTHKGKLIPIKYTSELAKSKKQKKKIEKDIKDLAESKLKNDYNG